MFIGYRMRSKPPRTHEGQKILVVRVSYLRLFKRFFEELGELILELPRCAVNSDVSLGLLADDVGSELSFYLI